MLKGRTAVITGASRGIGEAIAVKFAKNGANIAAVYSGNKQAAQEALSKIEQFGAKAMFYQCDVSDFEKSKEVCMKISEDFDGVDILVNNAGITKDALILQMNENDFDSVIGVNLKGSFNFTKHLSRYIMKSSCGRIINISSVIALMGNKGQANYSASKAGLIGLTKTVAKELSSRNVTCNTIAPGFIETDMTAQLPQKIKDDMSSLLPLKRMGKADEVAELALFLASDLSGYITGEVIRIDGGMCM